MAQVPTKVGDSPASLLELAIIYLRFGLTAFGGPAAHIAMMHREFVVQRRWLSDSEFADLLGAVNLIPGPNSTQMAIFIGKTRAGVRGLIVAGTCFILPAALIVCACAWAYRVYGSSPDAERLMYGAKPVIIAVIAQATWTLLRATVKDRFVGAIGVVAVGLSLANLSPLGIVFGCGASAALVKWVRHRKQDVRPLLGILGLVASFVVLASVLGWQEFGRVPFGTLPLFVFFLRVGSVLYGSGYTLLAT
jgi:chromate transporter